MKITREQARRFLLRKQGLLGEYRFAGKRGALDYVRQAGCIQFDPVDVCGKMAELTLQSRVKGFTKRQLDELLYKDRALLDYPDKQLSILPTENWAYYTRYREAARAGGKRFPGLSALETEAVDFIEKNGAVSAEELPLTGKLHWHSEIHWSGNWHGESNAARSVLEQLYSTGELVIHHKKGSRKYYDLAARHLPPELLDAPDPLPDDFAHQTWRVRNRIGAAGLIWDRASGFWNNVWKLNAEIRHRIFAGLVSAGTVSEVSVDGIRDTFYYLTDDAPLLEEAVSDEKFRPRCEWIAPLDPFLWDKELIRRLFDFDYAWEIYTPDEKRKYGAYTLPVLWGERFVGRVEAVNDRKTKTLFVKNLWLEPGIRQTKKLTSALEQTARRFAAFNDCSEICYAYRSETSSRTSASSAK